jgi:hypothetical protein
MRPMAEPAMRGFAMLREGSAVDGTDAIHVPCLPNRVSWFDILSLTPVQPTVSFSDYDHSYLYSNGRRQEGDASRF